eukprot:1779602-Prymnesium_polylepis.1
MAHHVRAKQECREDPRAAAERPAHELRRRPRERIVLPVSEEDEGRPPSVRSAPAFGRPRAGRPARRGQHGDKLPCL